MLAVGGVAFENSTDGLPTRFPSAVQSLEQEQNAILLQCALLKLPPEKREILILSRYQDLRYEQIASLLGCEVGTIKVRVYRAIKELRDIFLKLSSEKTPCNVKKSVSNSRIM